MNTITNVNYTAVLASDVQPGMVIDWMGVIHTVIETRTSSVVDFRTQSPSVYLIVSENGGILLPAHAAVPVVKVAR